MIEFLVNYISKLVEFAECNSTKFKAIKTQIYGGRQIKWQRAVYRTRVQACSEKAKNGSLRKSKMDYCSPSNSMLLHLKVTPTYAPNYQYVSTTSHNSIIFNTCSCKSEGSYNLRSENKMFNTQFTHVSRHPEA